MNTSHDWAGPARLSLSAFQESRQCNSAPNFRVAENNRPIVKTELAADSSKTLFFFRPN